MGCYLRALIASYIAIGLVLQARCQADEHYKVFTNRYYSTIIDKAVNNEGACSFKIAVQGKGIEDTFETPCKDDLTVVNTDDLLVIGHPKNDPFSLMCFGDTRNVAVVVNNGMCTMNVYTDKNVDGVPLPGKDVSPIPVQYPVCTELMDKVDKIIQKSKAGEDDPDIQSVSFLITEGEGKLNSKFSVITTANEVQGKCIETIKVQGHGVEDSFRGPCVEGLEMVNEIGVLIIGNPDKNPFIIFTDKPKSLVIVKDGICKERTYTKDNTKISSTSKDLETEQCHVTQTKIRREWAKRKTNNEGDEKLTDTFSVTTTTSERNKKCFQELKIVGNKIDDNFRSPCINGLEVINEVGILIIGDPDKTPFTIFTDKAKSLLIVKDGICKVRSYTTENGKTINSVTELDEDKCGKAQDKIRKQLKKRKPSDQGLEDDKLSSKFSVSTTTSERNKKCFQNTKIEGNGVEDNFRSPCVDGLEVINEVGVLIIGDPDKTPFTIFTDKAKSLLIVRDGICKVRSYTTENGKTISSSTELDEAECDKEQDKIRKELKKRQAPKKGDEKISKFTINTSNSGKNGRCFQTIKIEGNGVEDSFKNQCVDNLPILNEDGVLIIGDPDNTPFLIFTDKASSLLIVRDEICKVRSYVTESGKTTSSSIELDEDKCDKEQDKIKELLRNRQNSNKDKEQESSPYVVTTENVNRKRRCVQVIKVEGNGITDSFTGSCSEEFEMVKKADLLVVGEPAKTSLSLFSNKPNSLVVLKDGFCKQKTYKVVDGKTTSSSKSLDDDECEELEDTIEKELEEMRKQSQKGKKPEIKYTVTTDTVYKRKRCFISIKIKGNGIEDEITKPCVTDLEMVKEGVLVVGDPQKNPFALFTDKANSLVIVAESGCKEKTYTVVDGKTTSSSVDLDDDKCEEVESKIEEVLSKKNTS